MIAGDQQAIPLLLRVRQLDPRHLPRGADLIELVTASKDRAALMPRGWIQRQLRAGRVLLMLDGLDEIDPALRDACLLPWLSEMCQQYPHCRYVVSARPAGYAPGALRELGFVECEMQDLDDAQVREFTRHWSTAVRLARNEPESEARREGAVDGERIVVGFQDHPYIRHLARNPLMLSAICLVNYFEGSDLPQDRALLYRLCVEGLLHNWDRRRGIRSDYSFDEKLRVCREVALAMQADDRAEYEAEKVLAVVQMVLTDPGRAARTPGAHSLPHGAAAGAPAGRLCLRPPHLPGIPGGAGRLRGQLARHRRRAPGAGAGRRPLAGGHPALLRPGAGAGRACPPRTAARHPGARAGFCAARRAAGGFRRRGTRDRGR